MYSLDNKLAAIAALFLLALISCGPGGDPADADGSVSDAALDDDTEIDTDEDGGTNSTDQRPPTTVVQTIVPLLPTSAQKIVDRPQWGLSQLGPGEPHLERNDLGAVPAREEPLGEPTSVVYFWHLADAQIVDEESPARLINGEAVSESAYRNQESWSLHFLEATVRTGNQLASFRAFDFALLAGDMIDNIQRNEQDWLLTIMEGGIVESDSGDDNDPIDGEANDQHDAFTATGLDPAVPWYTTLGNHDELIQGNFDGLSASLVASPTGTAVSALSAAVIPTCLDEPWFDDESPEPKRCYMPPKSSFNKRTVVADAERAFISRREWLESFFGTQTIPDGHGLTPENLDAKTAYYAVDGVVPGVPSALIVLSTVSSMLAGGAIGEPQLNWLAEQLDVAEAAGKLVMVAGHHPLRSIGNGANNLATLLSDHPNVVIYLAGHTHQNRVTPHPAPEGLPPEHGFWEVETSAIIDWPQQTRIVEIVDNRDGTGAVYCTMLDYQIPVEMPLLDGGRFYTLFDIHGGGGAANPEGALEDRNVILRVTWPEAVAENLDSLPHREVESLLF